MMQVTPATGIGQYYRVIVMQAQLERRDIQRIGHYAGLNLDELTPETVNKLYYQMMRLRRIKEALHAEYHRANEKGFPIYYVERPN